MRWRMGAVLAGLAAASYAALGSSTVVVAVTPTDPAATYKAAHDTDPHIALSAQDQAAVDQKMLSSRQAWDSRQSGVMGPLVLSSWLAANQQAQTTSYYCGPATVSEALGAKSVSLNQSDAAYLLVTTSSGGTAWSGVNARVPSPTGYPVRDVLNYKLSTTWYAPVGLPYSPSSNDVSNYEANLMTDIYDYRYPIAGDAWEVVNGPHLVGHPTNLEIFHWFEIRGFTNTGTTTAYEDSVHGATSISWSGSVPAYSNYDSPTLVTIMGGRGYVW